MVSFEPGTEPVPRLGAAPPEPRPFTLASTFAALRHRNYRLWFRGQLVSLFGTWMQITAQGFLAFELTRSPAFLGTIVFVAGIPAWMFMLYGGVIADRVPRRRLLMITQSVMMALAAILALLAFTGWVRPWHLLVLAFLQGVANAFDAPARQSFVPELVDRADLTNAIALNSTMFNTATSLGPAIGGLIYAFLGPGWCFTINAVSFLAILASLVAIRVGPMPPSPPRTSVLRELGAGVRYALGHPVIRALLLLVAVTTLCGFSFITLVPAWAVKILHGDAATNGWLQSGRGVGALAGALFIASLGRRRRQGRVLMAGTLGFPLLLGLFTLVRVEWLAVLTLVGVGFGLIMVYNLCNALVQTHAEDALRGRVMGIYTLSFFGLMPFGGLLAGGAAELWGEAPTVAVSAGITLLCFAMIWATVPRLKDL